MSTATTHRSTLEVICISFVPASVLAVLAFKSDAAALYGPLSIALLIGLAVAAMVFTNGPVWIRLVGTGTMLAVGLGMGLLATQFGIVLANFVFIVACMLMVLLCALMLGALQGFIDYDDCIDSLD